MSFLIHNCIVKKLSKDVVENCRPFHCKHDSEIEKFFRSEFELFDKELFAKSYGFITDEENPRLVCAFSVSNSLLPRDILPPKSRNRVDRKVPNSKRKYEHPAVLVGQLAVFDEFAHQRLGDELMKHIKLMLRDEDYQTACRFIIVDAINDPHVLDFYLRNGFQFFFDTLEEELESLDVEIRPEAKRTRLMYFDLIKLSTANF